MAELKPFSAWRYDLDQVRPEKVIAPPYDVIDETERDRLYEGM